MQPLHHEVEKLGSLPLATSATPAPDEDPTPLSGGADAPGQSWASLGSTRVIEGQTPSAKARDPQAPPEPDNARNESSDFQRLQKIGEGAMGVVYKARQISFDRIVALKVLFPHIASNPKLVERMDREGRVMGRLDHPNIVQSFGIFEEGREQCIALEYVDGLSMQKWMAKLGRLSLGDALHITLVCAQALDYAHQQGLVHRDIKPDNILITSQGIVKVADLGMVKSEDEDMSLTQTGHAVGTPWYMPLEQAKNAKETDGRSDIYALGCMLYCFLTGNPPFAGKTLLEVIKAKEAGTFPPARQSNPEVPERVDLIIHKMTQKYPKNRYQTCAELVKDLETLQLASESLTFLEDKKPDAEATSLPKHPSSFSDQPAAPANTNVWFVRIKDADGQTHTQRLTTAQVLKMLEEDVLAPNAKASHDAKEGFRALATYKEFQGRALVKVSKQASEEHTNRYRALYKEIEEQANQPKEEKPPALTPVNWLPVEMPEGLPLALKIGGGILGLIVLFSFFSWLVR
jgi:serine/threonine protein kinase